MKYNSVKDVDISKLAQDLGMSKTEVIEILTGNYKPRKLSFTIQDVHYVPERKQPVYVPPVQKIDIQQQIKEADDVDTLWEILSTLSFDDIGYVAAYEKLTGLIKEAYENTNDKDELEELLHQTPSGSKEEALLINKLSKIESDKIKNENSIDELISLYEDENYYDDSKRLIVEKILSLATSASETKEIIDNQNFNEGTWEYYALIQKHMELVRKEISAMTSIDDTESINDYIPITGSDEEVMLAQKIATLCPNDPESLWNESGVFNSSSEAYEILALAVIEQSNDYEHSETLNEIINEFDSESRIGRMAAKKKTALTMAYAKNLTDTSELEDIINELGKDDLNRKILEEKLISLVEDYDELNDIITNNDGYLEQLAREKLDKYINEAIKKASLDDLENLEQYVEEDSTEKNQLDLKTVELCSSADDADNISMIHNSYAEYLMAKKFGQKASAYVEPQVQVPIIETPTPEETAENLLQQQKLEQQELELKKIKRFQDVEEAISFFNGMSADSVNRKIAYEKSSELLDNYLRSQRDPLKVKQLLDLFPEETQEWMSIIQKLSNFYPKPWYMFW